MSFFDKFLSALDLKKSEPLSTPIQPDLVKSMPAKEPIAMQEAPYATQLLGAMGYKEKPSNLTYHTLYQMSVRNSVIAAVIATRINQVSNFTKPARYSLDKIGYEIRLRDPEQKPTEEQHKLMLAMEVFLENCGYTNDNTRDDFDTFIRKIIRDSLTYDQLTFEIIRDKKGRPAEIIAVDASTIRVVTDQSRDWAGNKEIADDDTKYVQVVDGVIQARFTIEDLAFCVRNPRSSIYMQPYGFSELEQLINQITSHLYAEEYNSRFFSQGGTTKGIINLKGEGGIGGVANTQQLESFKRQWQAQVSGLTGAWKTPVVQIPGGIEYLNVSQSNREMEFEQWMNYLINIVCAVYQIDPAEVNFPNNGGAGGHAGNAFSENDVENKLKNSRDKGLRPLLRFLETTINKYIISQFSQDFVFNFIGLDEKSENEQADLIGKEIRTYKTINEIRKEKGLDEIDFGDIILDGTWTNYKIQMEAQEQQAAMMANNPTGEEQPADNYDEMYGSFADTEETTSYTDEGDVNISGENDNYDDMYSDVSKSINMEKSYTIEIDF